MVVVVMVVVVMVVVVQISHTLAKLAPFNVILPPQLLELKLHSSTPHLHVIATGNV
tara:strand:- start:60 stop:227 length:168 start_codon:yes stop_codon:yes gene_type:complete